MISNLHNQPSDRRLGPYSSKLEMRGFLYAQIQIIQIVNCLFSFNYVRNCLWISISAKLLNGKSSYGLNASEKNLPTIFNVAVIYAVTFCFPLSTYSPLVTVLVKSFIFFNQKMSTFVKYNEPSALDRNRTCDLPLRRRLLYPTELRGQCVENTRLSD